MLRTSALFCILLYRILLFSQEDISYEYPNGVYASVEDFMAKNPDTVTMIRKVNLDVDLSKAFLDTLMDRCFFINKDRDPLKKVFAVVHQGQIYFQEYGVSRHLMPGYNKRAKNELYFCYRVLERGAYMYCNALEARPGYYGGGLLGVALAELEPGLEMEAGIAFHPRLKVFFSFNSCPQFEKFVKRYHAAYQFDCQNRAIDTDILRDVFSDLNSTYHTE